MSGFTVKRYNDDELNVLDDFYHDSSLTEEGLIADQDNLVDYYEYLKNNVGVSDMFCFHVFTGEQINSWLGRVHYPYDFNIVIVELKDIKDVNKLACFRFSFGGRWFDDVVDNVFNVKSIKRS